MESYSRNGKRRKIRRIKEEPLCFLKPTSTASSYYMAFISSISELIYVLF